jgi:hypothetical protein
LTAAKRRSKVASSSSSLSERSTANEHADEGAEEEEADAADLAAFCRCLFRDAFDGPPWSTSVKTFWQPASKAVFFSNRLASIAAISTFAQLLVSGSRPAGGGGTTPSIVDAAGLGGTAAHDVAEGAIVQAAGAATHSGPPGASAGGGGAGTCGVNHGLGWTVGGFGGGDALLVVALLTHDGCITATGLKSN